jgi:hypothetical protein
VLYVVLMVGCKIAFVRETYSYIPNRYIDAHHKVTSTVLYVVCFSLFIYMCLSDPGVITPANLEQFHEYPSHPVLYPENKFCRTCKTRKCVATTDSEASWVLTWFNWFRADSLARSIAVCAIVASRGSTTSTYIVFYPFLSITTETHCPVFCWRYQLQYVALAQRS